MADTQRARPARATSAQPVVATWTPLRLRWKLCVSGSALGAEAVIGYRDPTLGIALAVADILIPLAIALILLAAILHGSRETSERAFRLLRWITNRPEPPAPRRRTVT